MSRLNPRNSAEFRHNVYMIEGQLDISVRFPRWPFRNRRGAPRMYEYDRLIGGGFGAVLAGLAQHYGDDRIAIVAPPSLEFFLEAYGFYPGFLLSGGSLR